MTSLLPFGPGAWAFISVYLLSLLLIGWFSYKARRENSLKDFYLAGKGFGMLVLVFTLFATQYSGNTMFGFTGKTYRIGYSWIMSLHFMTAIVVCYLLFAPRLYKLAKEKNFITPVDYITDRFSSGALSLISSIIMIVALSNFLLAQLMAMGRALQGLASAHPEAFYQYGVITLAVIMVIYGSLGGIRAVAWTDVIQGVVLMLGFTLLMIIIYKTFGSLEETSRILINSDDPAVAAKAASPDPWRLREWLSYIFMVGLGGALYPQAIQRLYAAGSAIILRKSLTVMVFLPLLAILIAVYTGITAAAHMPGMEGIATDQILVKMLAVVQAESMLGYCLVVVLFAAALSAMMSTADSALLSISSMLTKDIYGQHIRRGASESELTLTGKILSWSLIVLLVFLAIYLRDETSLIRLLDRKFDLLVQLVPAFMLGVHWRGLKAGPVLLGVVVGISISLVLAFGGFEFVKGGKVEGIHPGLIGLLFNFTVAVVGSFCVRTTN